MATDITNGTTRGQCLSIGLFRGLSFFKQKSVFLAKTMIFLPLVSILSSESIVLHRESPVPAQRGCRYSVLHREGADTGIHRVIYIQILTLESKSSLPIRVNIMQNTV